MPTTVLLSNLNDNAVLGNSSPYIFNVGHASGGQTFATGATTIVDFDTIHFDPNSNFNTSTNTYTVPVTGYWYLHSQLLWANTSVFNATERTDLRVYINNILQPHFGFDIAIPDDNSTYTDFYTMKTNGIAFLDAGDEITIRAFQGTGVNQFTHNSNKYTCFSGALLTAI